MKISSKKIAAAAICSALAALTFAIESLFPPMIIPGARMGLSNAFVLLALITLGGAYGFAVLTVKCLIGSIFSGNFSAILYSLPAGTIALAAELSIVYFIKNTSVVAASVCGAVINVTVQNVIFCLITKTTEYLVYTPYLALIGVISGLTVGFAVYLTIKRLPEKLFIENNIKTENKIESNQR